MLYNTLNFLFILVEVLLLFNLLILVHELGHFLAAKWRGLYIDGFGIWFGKPIWQKKINGVTYSLGSIPAGGFVKLPQMAPMEAIEGETAVDAKDMPPITALDKIIVAFAGPLFSFGLAFVFAVIVWQVGRPVGESEGTRTVGYVMPDSPADKAGFQVGDEILNIDGHKVDHWGGMGSGSITWLIVRSEGKTVPIEIKRGDKDLTLLPEPKIPEKAHWWNRKALRQIGLMAAGTPVSDKPEPNSPAEKAGLKPGDRIEEIDGEKLNSPIGIYDYMKRHPADTYTLTIQRGTETIPLTFTPRGTKVASLSDDPNSPASLAKLKVGDIINSIDGVKLMGSMAITDYIQTHGEKPLTLNITRDGKPLPVTVTPQIPENAPDGESKPRIGIVLDDDDGFMLDGMGILTPTYPTPVEQIRASMKMIFNTIDAIVSPKSSIGIQHMGGPVMMMRAYYVMFENKEGWRLALWFSVVLNVNLAMLNLLPIPVLDGGHIALALIEAVRRKPVNLKVLEMIQTACAVVIIGFMFFIFFFDVQDLPWFPASKTPQMKFRTPTPDTQK
ncbi:MAG: site-2 protease family protein [Chthoniobacteraceae bacterium]